MKKIIYILLGLSFVSCNHGRSYFSSRVAVNTENASTEIADNDILVNEDYSQNETHLIYIEENPSSFVYDEVIEQKEPKKEIIEKENRSEQKNVPEKIIQTTNSLKKVKKKREIDLKPFWMTC